MISKTVIIVAGGKGSRMQSETPKQFLKIDGKPILVHTVERFIAFDPQIQIVLVLPEEHIHIWEELAQEHKISHPVDVVIGGQTRYHSVQNGMQAVKNTDVVGIHDGVRPLVSNTTLNTCYNKAHETGNAIPSLAVDETLRQLSESSSKWMDRSRYRTIQTPQCFRSELIKDAYSQNFDNSFTDDASVLEKTGVKINLVEGNRENIKITRPDDLQIAKALMNLL